MFVLKHVSPFHFLGKQNSSKCRSFCRVNIDGIRFSERKCYNTSWHRYIRLLGSLTLHSETAVENFMASQAPQTSSEESEYFEFPLTPKKIRNIRLRS